MALDRKNNLFIACGICLMLLSCTSARTGVSLAETKKRIEILLTNERILTLSDLDDDTRLYFQESTMNAEPGIVCSTFINENQTSCFALVVSANSKKTEANRLIFLKNISNASTGLETIEDYSSEKRQTTNMFLVFQKKETIENRGEGASTIQMPQDGVMRIAYGQSALVLFWEEENIQKVWSAD